VFTDFEVSTALPFSACFTVAILIPPATGSRSASGGTLLFYTPGEQGVAFPPRKRNSIRGPSGRHPPEIIEKKRMHCPMPVKFPRPNSKFRAYLRLRGAGTSRSFFGGDTGLERGAKPDQGMSRLGPSGASTSPNLDRSIGLGGVGVKRKSQNLVRKFL